MFSIGLAIAPTQAQTRLTGFKTTGRDMDGLRVSVGFLGGGSETVLWSDQPESEAGGAFGNGWSLFQRGDTFKRPWLFEVDDRRPVNSLILDAVSGNTVFDNVEFDFLTEGSKDGFPFTVVDGETPTTVDYSRPIDISEGDLFGQLNLAWEDGFDGRLIFFADTDNGTEAQPVSVAPPAPPPEAEQPPEPEPPIEVVEPPLVIPPPSPPTPVEPVVIVEPPELVRPPAAIKPIVNVEPPDLVRPPVAIEPTVNVEPPETVRPPVVIEPETIVEIPELPPSPPQPPQKVSEPSFRWSLLLVGGTVLLLRRRLSNSTQP